MWYGARLVEGSQIQHIHTSQSLGSSRQVIAVRQQTLKKRLRQRGVTVHQAMQSVDELRAIPDESDVAVHLLRSAIGAIPEHKRILAAFGLLENRQRGKKRKISSGHIGKTVHCQWYARWAEGSDLAQITRYAYFDPGDEVLLSLDSRGAVHMNVERFQTSLGELAAIIGGEHRPVRIESQPDGFGITWHTELDVVVAMRRALAVIGEPSHRDEATIIRDATPQTCPGNRVVQALLGTPETVSLVQVDIGTASLAWSQSGKDTAPDRQMSFGDDYYIRSQVRSLLADTAVLSDGTELGIIIDVADDTLTSHSPSAQQSR
jgi:hypothetical protein